MSADLGLADFGRATRRALWPCVLAAQAGACAYAVADVAFALRRIDALGLFWAIGFALPIGALAALAIAPMLAAWTRPDEGVADLLRRFRQAEGRTAAIAAAAIAILIGTAGSAGFSIFAVSTFHHPGLTAIACALASVGSAAIGALLYGVVRRAIPARARAADVALTVALLAPASAALAVSTMHGGSRAIAIRGVALALFAVVVAFAVLRLAAARIERLPRWARAIGLALTALAPASALALSSIGDGATLREELWSRASFVPAAAGAIEPLLDRDGDGFTGVLGGGDCAEGDAARSPRGVEREANGIDEDCRFGDLTPPSRAHAPSPALVHAVFLVTVAGLDVAADGSLAPTLPAVEERIVAGVRFREPVGIAAPFRHVAIAMLRGRLPWKPSPEGSGLPHGGPSIPTLLENAGGHGIASLQKPGRFQEGFALFVAANTFTKGKSPNEIVDGALRLAGARGGRVFAWVHLDLGKKGRAEVDQAIARLIDRAQASSDRVILVALADDKPARPGRDARGGPIAIVGSGIAPRDSRDPVGLLDVYPTVLEFLGLADSPDEWPELEPAAGTSLLAPRDAAITAWIDEREVVVGAVGAQGAAIHDERARRFTLRPRRGAASTVDEGSRDAPPWAAPLVALARDAVLAPRLSARNRLVAAARHAALPAGLSGHPATIAHTLRIHGCTVEPRPGRQVLITVYAQGGDRLDPEQFFAYRVFSPGRSAMHGSFWPIYGGLPFGSWGRGELVALPILMDERQLATETAVLWLRVADGKGWLDVSEGEGSTPGWAQICPFEVAP